MLIENIRQAPSNENGLIIPPPAQECIGPECYPTVRNGRCFISRHHYYFPNTSFRYSETAQLFYEHPYNRRSMHHCRHTELHQTYNRSGVPDEAVMEAVLDEYKLLSKLQVVLGALEVLNIALRTDDVRKKARDPQRYQAHVEQFTEKAYDLGRQVGQLEVVQPEIIALCVGDLALVGVN